MRENPPLKLDKLPPDVFLIELRMQMHNFIENKTILFVRAIGGEWNSCGQICQWRCIVQSRSRETYGAPDCYKKGMYQDLVNKPLNKM